MKIEDNKLNKNLVKININPFKSPKQLSIFKTSIEDENKKTLKEKHFEKYFNNLLQTMQDFSKSYNPKSNMCTQYKKFNLTTERQLINDRNLKNPKSINYKLYKCNPYFQHFKKNNLSYSKTKNLNLKKLTKKTVSKIINDPNSLTCIPIECNSSKSNNNTKSNNDYSKSKEINTDHISNYESFFLHPIKKNNLKNYYLTNIREGLYGQKDTIGVPYFYEQSSVFRNEYSNKSEKNRHESLLNEFGRLKCYLIRNPNKKLSLIKDFMNKYHIEDIDKYSDEQLLKLADFICNEDENILSCALKPYLNMKNMLYDILNNSTLLTKKDKKNKNDENKKTDMNKSKNKSNYYLSPLLSEVKSKYNSNPLKVKDNVKKKINKNVLDLFKTNSNLRYMDYQTKSYKDIKNYSSKYIVDVIGNEIKEIENDYNKRLKDLETQINKDKNLININLANQKNDYKKKYLSIKFANENKFYIQVNHNKKFCTYIPIHYNLLKYIQNEANNSNQIQQKNSEANIQFKNSFDICLSSRRNNSNENKVKRPESADRSKQVKYNRTEIVKRLYYNPTRKKFGMQEIKNRLKLTEYIALNFAKNNLLQNEIKKKIN